MNVRLRSKQYSRIRNASHDSLALYANVGSVSRFRSWWLENPERKTLPDGIDPEELNNKLRTTLVTEERIRRRFYRALKEAIFKVIPKHRDNPPMKGRNCWFQAGYDSNGVYNRFLVELLPDRVSLTHLLDTSYQSNSNKTGYSSRSLDSELHQAFSSLSELQEEYETTIDDEKANAEFWEEHWDDVESASAYINHEVWTEIEDKLNVSELQERTARNEISMCLFADFVGVIHPAADTLPDYKEADPDRHKEDIEKLNNSNIMDRKWMYVKGANYHKSSDVISSTKQLVACEFRTDVGIYVSALGQQDGRIDSRETDAMPIEFQIFAKTSNFKQLGRLLAKINKLGEQRLLALRDLDKLSKVGRTLENLGVLMDSIDRIEANDEGARQLLANINSRFDSIGAKIEGGLSSRISQSRINAETYRRLISSESFRKIPGFETYQEFAERRVFENFHFIDELGERLERLRSRIVGLQGRLQLRSMERLNRDSSKSLRETTSILRVGAIIEYIVVPFYLVSIFEGSGFLDQSSHFKEPGLFVEKLELFGPLAQSNAYLITYLMCVCVMVVLGWLRRNFTKSSFFGSKSNETGVTRNAS